MFEAPSLAARVCCSLGLLKSLSMSLGDLPVELRFCCLAGWPTRDADCLLLLLLLLSLALSEEAFGVTIALVGADCDSGTLVMP